MVARLKPLQQLLALGLACLLTWPVSAQTSGIAPEKPQVPIFWRPYTAPFIPPARTLNPQARLRALVRAGKLYLTAQDAIALALENNIDLEIQRYNPVTTQVQIQRAQGGGALRGVTSGTSQVGQATSGQGVSGSQTAANVSVTGNAATRNGSTANATVSQIGPVTQVLDPTLQASNTFSHLSTPQPNQLQSLTTNLIQSQRLYNYQLQQGLLTGGQVSLTYRNSYLQENASSDVLNPTVAPTLTLQAQHNFLNGFGRSVNSRFIEAAKVNLQQSEEQFSLQVITVTANTLNLYWGLVSDYEDYRAKRGALGVAERFLHDNQRQVEVGTLAPIAVTQAQAEVATRQQDLIVSETTLLQQQVALKNQISRNGLADPLLANVDIVPLDTIQVPTQEQLAPLNELVGEALRAGPDIAAERLGLESARINALGTENGVRPTLAGIASASAAGLAGEPSQFGAANPYFFGGVDNALGQIFRRNFPSQRASAFFQASLRNRVAQADYGIEQLQLRQNALTTQKDVNQVTVTVSNALIGLQQARARYSSAATQRRLQQQLYDSEQKKFSLGASTTYLVIQYQRDLANAEAAEVGARANYMQSRIALDRALGRTLIANNVSLNEARTGQVGRLSGIPAEPPKTETVPTPKQ